MEIRKKNTNLNTLIPKILQIFTQVSVTPSRLFSVFSPANSHNISTDKSFQLLENYNPESKPASHDVETVFTKVSMDDLIDIICKMAYCHESIPTPPMNGAILRKLHE